MVAPFKRFWNVPDSIAEAELATPPMAIIARPAIAICLRMGWTGRALAPNGFRWGLRSTRSMPMSQKTHAAITRTIGIDTGKNTLHLVGLDDRGDDRFA